MHILFRCFLFLSLIWVAVACDRSKPSETPLADPKAAPAPDAELKALNEAIEKDPNVATHYSRRATAYLERKENALALTDIDKAIALDSTKGEFYFVKSRVLRAQNQVPTALKTAIKAEQKGFSDAGLFVSMGEMFLIFKQYQKSIEYLNKSLQKSQFNEQAYFYKGLVYSESGDTALALSSLRTAIEMDPKYVDAYNQLFKIHNAKKEYELARQYLASGLRFAPADGYLWFNQGVLFRNTSQPDTAIASFQRALQLDSSLYLASYEAGKLLYQKESYKEAVPYLQRAYSNDSNLLGIEGILAYSLEQAGELQRAKEMYQRASDENPTDTEVQKGFARVDAQLRKSAAATP